MKMLGRMGQKGVTIIEMMIIVSISTIVIMALLRFIVTGNPLSKVAYLQAKSSETARIQLKRIARAIREARESETGAYPLVEMQPQRLVFYADIDGDNVTEKVKYELVGVALVRGVTEPTGDPPVYDPDTENVTAVAKNIVNGTTDVFTYYSGDYPDDTTSLTPMDVTEVKYIQFRLLVDANDEADPPPIDVRSQVQLRNLKTNLGETTE